MDNTKCLRWSLSRATRRLSSSSVFSEGYPRLPVSSWCTCVSVCDGVYSLLRDTRTIPGSHFASYLEIQRQIVPHIFRCISNLPSQPPYRLYLGHSHRFQAVQCHSTQWRVPLWLFLSRRSHPLEKTVCRAILRYTLCTSKPSNSLIGRYYADSVPAFCFISLTYRLRLSTVGFVVTVTHFYALSM